MSISIDKIVHKSLLCCLRPFLAWLFICWILCKVDIKGLLPTVPIPLLQDEVATVDLQGLLGDVCDRGGFDYTLDYGRPLNPELLEDKASWVIALDFLYYKSLRRKLYTRTYDVPKKLTIMQLLT